ncbi:hypothetical protein AOT83_04550 [Mycobacteroides sp. H001]|uniref:hypothetical protein n=1 Tax=unclassified Mycobacteroides TaxID=2618759 RepID=UPI0007161520|nr:MULTISPECIES: hypothetical protein [unclassified Mycobacteroides]KRQ31378.1 hypothetical protein AOT86_01850 [Mycobacteroides sp. H072]KRQ35863.1 hypothetical protein AOT84_15255 [Mycobacteroides sp. H002]KRQ50597.1 hypothetical protein AOT85_13970 [Mycobacteroides sp. H054]KRQ72641.1 hypothetical protein AOT83_04550 [Mycobacteroides sp. H001]
MSLLPSTEEELEWVQRIGATLDAMVAEHRSMREEHGGTPPLKMLSDLLKITVKTFGTDEFLRMEDLIDLFMMAMDRLAQQEMA